ncbi:hypothetical protein V2I28_03015 [Campylobacter sp. CX2-4080-23]|uniref:hypothetical protein n=1 Tax=Campylobacter porcelli TaxID=1660073 RepID=UPI002EB214C3|nr:hypothetical protein [Campylobacter sp. CX2-4080-23]
MAAWFNPRAVTYNANPNLVAQSGAIGDTLYKLYQDARANRQEQDKQNELIRQFNATFGENQRQFNINQENKNKEFEITKNQNDFNNNLALQKFYLDQQKLKENQRQFNEDLRWQRDKELDLGIRQKNIPVSEQHELKKVFTALEQAKDLDNFVNSSGGWDTYGGLFDRVKTLAPNAFPSGADYNAKASNVATSVSEILKGQGKYNYENLYDNLKPAVLGTNQAQSTLNETRQMILNRAEELVSQIENQGYIGADETRKQLETIKQSLNAPKENKENKEQDIGSIDKFKGLKVL